MGTKSVTKKLFRLFTITAFIAVSSVAIGCTPFDSIALTSDGSTDVAPTPTYKHVYVSDVFAKVYHCLFDASAGALSDCSISDVGVTLVNPESVTPFTIGGITKAYLADENGDVFLCDRDSETGHLSDCIVNNGGITGWVPGGVTVAEFGGTLYAYVADVPGNMYLCNINPTSGLFTVCNASNGGIGANAWWPTGIFFTKIDGVDYGYVPDGMGDIYVCLINSLDGELDSCTPQGLILSWMPNSIALAQVYGIRRAYVADDDGKIRVCDVNDSNGFISACVESNGGNTAWQPESISPVTEDGITRLYIADAVFKIQVCALSNTTGLLTTCSVVNGLSNWTPRDFTWTN